MIRDNAFMGRRVVSLVLCVCLLLTQWASHAHDHHGPTRQHVHTGLAQKHHHHGHSHHHDEESDENSTTSLMPVEDHDADAVYLANSDTPTSRSPVSRSLAIDDANHNTARVMPDRHGAAPRTKHSTDPPPTRSQPLFLLHLSLVM
jgi:hypothetical protein